MGAAEGDRLIVPKCSEMGRLRSLRLRWPLVVVFVDSSRNGNEGEWGMPIVDRGLRGGFSNKFLYIAKVVQKLTKF